VRRDSLEEDRMSTITVDDLMKEIEKAAVEKQSDLLYKVKLMEAKQERDELVRTFVARLRGQHLHPLHRLHRDTCTKTVSHVEPTILLAGPSEGPG
jgi:hypothetical protein